MRNILKIVSIMFVLVGIAFNPAFAENAFHITYEQRGVSAADGIVSGQVVFTIVNASGGDVTNLVVSVDGPNHITYDSLPVIVPSLAAGEATMSVELFSAPGEVDLPEEQATLQVEYTDAAGAQQVVYVTGTLMY